MNRTFNLCALVGSLAVSSFTAQAATYTDVDVFNVLLSKSGLSSFSNSFDITADYTPNAGEEIVSAQAYFAFSDDLWDGLRGQKETILVDLGAENFSHETGASGIASILLPFTVLGGQINVLTSLNLSGTLDYTVTAKGGDFYFLGAGLTATSRVVPSNRVPDGGLTIALLGIALVAVSAVSRLRTAKS